MDARGPEALGLLEQPRRTLSCTGRERRDRPHPEDPFLGAGTGRRTGSKGARGRQPERRPLPERPGRGRRAACAVGERPVRPPLQHPDDALLSPPLRRYGPDALPGPVLLYLLRNVPGGRGVRPGDAGRHRLAFQEIPAYSLVGQGFRHPFRVLRRVDVRLRGNQRELLRQLHRLLPALPRPAQELPDAGGPHDQSDAGPWHLPSAGRRAPDVRTSDSRLRQRPLRAVHRRCRGQHRMVPLHHGALRVRDGRGRPASRVLRPPRQGHGDRGGHRDLPVRRAR